MENNITNASKVLTHKWQEQGLGQAPFRVECIISLPSKELLSAGNVDAYNNAMAEACHEARAYGVGLGTCNSCGMSLQNNVVIRDANRKCFVVGCDCAGKTDDSELIEQVELLERRRQKEIREAKAQAKEEARRAAWLAEQQAQRDRNGGLTDLEVAEKARKEAEEARIREYSVKNAWLLTVLDRVPYASDFVRSMIRDLEKNSLASLSGRCVGILAEIYAKTAGGRGGSKKYKAAYNEFYEKVAAERPSDEE